jgi:hypothetical protein
VGAFLVLLHEAAVGDHAGGESALDAIFGHMMPSL